MAYKFYTNEFVESIRNEDPNKILITSNDKFITAQNLVTRTIETAIWLKNNGATKQSKIVFAVKPDIDFVIYFLACLLIGSKISIIDPEMGEDNYKDKFNQFQPDITLVDTKILFLREHPILRFLIKNLTSRQLPNFPKSIKSKVIGCGLRLPVFSKYIHLPQKLSQLDDTIEWTDIDASIPFLVTYTSGSLGSPKGVEHTISSISKTMNHLKKLLDDDNTISIATHLPQYILLGIISGKQVHIWNNTWSGKKKIDYIGNNGITTLFGPPSDFTTMIDSNFKDQKKISFLKNIYLGSAPVYSNFLSKIIGAFPNTNIVCLYGMTENLLVSSISAKDKLNYKGIGDIVGNPFDDVIVKISPENEIVIASPQLFNNYYGSSIISKNHLTGDLGILNSDGSIILLGRKKDMIIRRNFNIYPALYEPTINKIKNINYAVMVGVYDDTIADELVYLCVESSQKMEVNYIMSILREGKLSIDREALPDKIIFINLPRSGRQQKVDKKKLQQILKSIKVED